MFRRSFAASGCKKKSEKLDEFLDGQSGLPDDAPESARLQIATSVDRHRYCSRWISRNGKDMVATGDPINDESCSRQAWIVRLPLTVGNRPPAMSGSHDHSANLRLGVCGDRDSMITPIIENG